MPRWMTPAMLVMALVGLIPLALVLQARVSTSSKPRVHVVFDMDQQAKFKPQQANPAFADGRAMRRPVPGTVARGDLGEDVHFTTGKVDGEWATELPMELTHSLMRRGRDRFAIYCAPCHGLGGDGRGPVWDAANEFVITSFHTDLVRDRADGHIFNTITNGTGNMAAYGAQISPKDRWAIVAYVRALQRARNASIEDVPPEYKDRLR